MNIAFEESLPCRIVIYESFAFEKGADFVDDMIKKHGEAVARERGWNASEPTFFFHGRSGSSLNDWREPMPEPCEIIFYEKK